ncbi:MAG: hypothetical protein B7Z52_01955 [Burkholderiales bacterium 12-64-5]|nr:MAG: hypothetical protein B7Z52_01955 [Burkholderiales bacterium 12-64-5]
MTTIEIGAPYVRPQTHASGSAATLDFLHTSGTDMLRAQAYATIQSFLKRGIPLREWRLPDLGAESIGELLMLSMMETVLMAELLGVNAFDQPAVEESKQLTIQLLQNQLRLTA